MSASEVLKQRSNKRIIETKFIEQVLNEEAANIEEAQNEVFANNFFKNASEVIQGRSYTVSNETLTLRHHIRQRFIDMKRTKYRTKPIPVHNKIIWGHFNNIVFKLAYGLTKEVKEAIAKQQNIEL